jgi:hypothetical protein
MTDGIFQRTVFGHGAKPNHTGGGFFRAADDVLHQVGALGEQNGDEIGAIVHGDLRFVVERGVDVRVIGGVVFALNGESGDVVILHQGRSDFVLGGERIRGAKDNVSAAIA